MTTRRKIAALAFALALAAPLFLDSMTTQIDGPCPRGLICIQTQTN